MDLDVCRCPVIHPSVRPLSTADARQPGAGPTRSPSPPPGTRGLRLAGSVDRVVGVHLLNDAGMTLCHLPRPAPSIRTCRVECVALTAMPRECAVCSNVRGLMEPHLGFDGTRAHLDR